MPISAAGFADTATPTCRGTKEQRLTCLRRRVEGAAKGQRGKAAAGRPQLYSAVPPRHQAAQHDVHCRSDIGCTEASPRRGPLPLLELVAAVL